MRLHKSISRRIPLSPLLLECGHLIAMEDFASVIISRLLILKGFKLSMNFWGQKEIWESMKDVGMQDLPIGQLVYIFSYLLEGQEEISFTAQLKEHLGFYLGR